MYTHIVFFHLVDPAEAQTVAEKLRGMAGRIPTLREIEVGVDDAPSPRSAHVSLITRFDDPAGLEAYAVHPVHLALLDWIRPRLERATKVDYPS
jgi:hypothetical protein